MKARVLIALARLPPLAALAGVLLALVGQSTLIHLFPGPTLVIAIAIIPLALLPALFAPRSPLPAALAVTVPVLALAAYDQSRLDWLRLLKDFGVSHPGTPNWARLGLSLVALLLAWGAHAADLALRLRRSAADRGVPAGQAKLAWKASATRTTRVAFEAAVGTAAIGGLAFALQRVNVALLFGAQASLLVPIVAVALVAVAAVLVAGGRGSRA